MGATSRLHLALSLLLALASLLASTARVQANELELAQLSQNQAAGLEQRVSATLALGQYSGANALIALARASRDEIPQMRMASIQAVSGWSEVARWDLVSPLLNDTNKQVQGQAIRTLLPLRGQLNSNQTRYFDQQVKHYLAKQSEPYSFERAEIYIAQQRYADARDQLRQLSADQANGERSALLFSEILVREGLDTNALAYLEQQQVQYPDSAPLHFQSGLIHARQGELAQSVPAFERAHQLEPEDPGYLRALATVQQQIAPGEAADLYAQLYQLEPRPAYLLAQCQSLQQAGLDTQECLVQLNKVAPADLLRQFNPLNNQQGG